jgi:hypothetical protein
MSTFYSFELWYFLGEARTKETKANVYEIKNVYE